MKRILVAGMAVALLFVGASFANAQANANAQGKKHDFAAALTAKLGLNNQQAEEVRKICTEFDAKKEPIEEQLFVAHHEARAEMQKLLTDEQRAKAPQVIKQEKERELQSIAAKVGLTDQQLKQVEGTLSQFHNKFQELSGQKPEDVRKQFHELKREVCAAVGKDLNDEERIRLAGVMREEFQHWQQPGFKREHVRAFEDKLGLTAEQKTKADKIIADCEKASEKPIAQLKEMCQQEREAIAKVLSNEQKTQLNQIMKSRGRNQNQ